MNMITLISGVLTVKTEQMLTVIDCQEGIAGYCNLMMNIRCIVLWLQ